MLLKNALLVTDFTPPLSVFGLPVPSEAALGDCGAGAVVVPGALAAARSSGDGLFLNVAEGMMT